MRSVVAGTKHIDMLESPTLFVAHDDNDRRRHEGMSSSTSNYDRHAVLAKNCGRLVGGMVSKPVNKLPSDFPLLQVDDPIKALIELGIAARNRYAREVVAVTGTVGKSTTVQMIQHMLGGRNQVLATIDNYNSRVGAPVMMASLGQDHAAAVVEVAMSALWMRRGPVTKQIRPTVSVITGIGLSQTNFGSSKLKDTVWWKTRIFEGLTENGIAVFGEHLEHFDMILAEAEKHAKRIVRFGRSQAAEIRILDVRSEGICSRVKLSLPQRTLDVIVPAPGPGMVHNAVAAIAVLYAIGQDYVAAVDRLASFKTDEGRLQHFEIGIAGGKFDLIDDSWNAEVLSMLDAFSVLQTMSPRTGGKKVAVLGRIVHLGDHAQALHESLAAPLLAVGASLVVTHGEEMLYLRKLLPQALLGPHFNTAADLVDYLVPRLTDGDLLLLKGSRRNSDFGDVGDLLRKITVDA